MLNSTINLAKSIAVNLVHIVFITMLLYLLLINQKDTNNQYINYTIYALIGVNIVSHTYFISKKFIESSNKLNMIGVEY